MTKEVRKQLSSLLTQQDCSSWYIRDVLHEANNDFPSIEFEYELPHKWKDEEYKNRYEELERQMMEVLNWRSRWFGKLDTNK
jgi:hypothetical protein